MPINPHAQRLEQERRAILRRRYTLRDFVDNAPFRISDSIDRAKALRSAASELNYLQREYERVCFALGRSPDISATRLDIPPVAVSRRAEARATGIKTTRSVPSYVTRMIGGPGCR